MKTLVITGATSFIGKAVVKAAKNWNVVAVVRRNSNKTDDLRAMPNVHIIELNMDEYETLGEKANAADCFLYLSWSGTRGADRMNHEVQKRNYEYGAKAISSMVESGCKRVVTAGSQAEYGNIDGLITEDIIPVPNTEYGKYKLALFNYTNNLCKSRGIAFKEPRIFSLYGPGDYENTLIMSTVQKMKRNEPCDMTEGIQKWDYLYIDDAAKGILALCESECSDGAYNLASGDVRTLRDYVIELKEVLGSKSKLNFGRIPYPASGMVSIEPCIDKIRKETDWLASTTFKVGVIQTCGN